LRGSRHAGAAGRWTWRCALALLLACPWPAWAASDIGQGSGLPSMLVQTLALDEDGYLWIGTQDGVVRFDSHRFLAVELDRGHEVPDRHVRELLAVPGAVYLATPSRLHRFDLATESLRAVGAGAHDIAGVSGLQRDRDGRIYAVTESGQLFRWFDSPDAIEVEQVALAADAPLPEINDLSLGRDAVWLATMRGAFRVDRGTWRTDAVRLALPEIRDGAVHVRAIHEADDGELWIGFWNDALVRHDPRNGATRWLRPGHADAGALRSTSIYSFLQTPRGLYIGTNRGIVVHRAECDCLRGLNHPAWDAVDGSGYVISDMVAEGDGVWAGVWGAGIVRFSATDEIFDHQVRVDGRDDTLAHPMVYSLHVGSAGQLWIGTYGGGVQWVDAGARARGETWSMQRVPWGPRAVETRFIWTLHEDAGRLLIGAGYGWIQWDGQRLTDVDPAQQSVRSYLKTSAGTELVGTMFGLRRVASDGLHPVDLAIDGAPLPSTAAWSLSEHAGEVWVGTAKGLVRLSPGLDVIAWHGVGGAPVQLPGAVVWTQKRGPDGVHWLGTSGGLVAVREVTGAPTFERHPLPAHLGIYSVGSIEFDTQGRLWLGTPKGLVRYDAGSRQAQLFDRQDGLVSDQLNSNASASDGERLYFGGIGGLVAFDPRAIPERSVRLAPDVVKLRLGQQSWQPRRREIALAHDHEPLQLEFSAHHFARPERVRYAYRWVPLETEFTELGDARSAVFSRLPSGRHTLELRASVSDAPDSAAIEAVMAVEVATAWHESVWGRVLIGIALLAFAYAVYFWRSRQSRLYAQGLARDVRGRTRELTEAKEALETANAKLQQQVAIDPLTGLDNRRQLFEVATRFDARGTALAAMLIDLDHFKRINDEHGHQVGDAVLVDFAAALRQVIGSRVACARYGGEEFLCLLDDAEAGAVDALAQRLLHEVRGRSVHAERAAVRYTASVGLAFGQPGESAEAVIRRADRALYRAKEQGRDRVAID
jgi:diguanylate cyclase (GGDEF)-like protein